MVVSIYELRDPRDLECKPKYIGITTRSLDVRLQAHIYEAKSTYFFNKHKRNWFLKLLSENVKPSIHLIEEVTSLKEGLKLESYWIKEFNDLGYNLLNLAKSGGGNFHIERENSWKSILILNLQLQLIEKTKNAKEASLFIFGTEDCHKKISTNCKFGFKTNKKFYVIKEEDYLNNNINFKLVRKKVIPSRGNCKSFLYNEIYYETKQDFQKFLKMQRQEFDKFFAQNINNIKFTKEKKL